MLLEPRGHGVRPIPRLACVGATGSVIRARRIESRVTTLAWLQGIEPLCCKPEQRCSIAAFQGCGGGKRLVFGLKIAPQDEIKQPGFVDDDVNQISVGVISRALHGLVAHPLDEILELRCRIGVILATEHGAVAQVLKDQGR